MLTILNKEEFARVSAGNWSCDDVYKDQKFLKATWFTSMDHDFGACHFGSKEGELYYSIPENLVGLEREISSWGYAGDKPGDYTKYECRESAKECIYKT